MSNKFCQIFICFVSTTGNHEMEHQTRQVFCNQVAAALDTSKGRLLMKKSPACRKTQQHEGHQKQHWEWQELSSIISTICFGGDFPKNIRFVSKIFCRLPLDAKTNSQLFHSGQCSFPTSLYSMRVLARTFNMLAIRGSRNFSAKASTFCRDVLKRQKNVKSKMPIFFWKKIGEGLLSVVKKGQNPPTRKE